MKAPFGIEIEFKAHVNKQAMWKFRNGARHVLDVLTGGGIFWSEQRAKERSHARAITLHYEKIDINLGRMLNHTSSGIFAQLGEDPRQKPGLSLKLDLKGFGFDAVIKLPRRGHPFGRLYHGTLRLHR